AQIDGLELPAEQERPTEVQRHEAAEALIKATNADIQSGGDRACYMPALDKVLVPPQMFFTEQEAFYGVTLHELGHYADLRIMPRSGRKGLSRNDWCL